MPDLAAVVSFLSTNIAVLIAAISALIAAKALIDDRETRELQLLLDTFKQITDTERDLYTVYKGKPEKDKREWDSLFFNNVEVFCFLVNEKFISNSKLAGFFDDAIVNWYQGIFLKHYPAEDIKNPKIFTEFKKRYFLIQRKRCLCCCCD